MFGRTGYDPLQLGTAGSLAVIIFMAVTFATFAVVGHVLFARRDRPAVRELGEGIRPLLRVKAPDAFLIGALFADLGFAILVWLVVREWIG